MAFVLILLILLLTVGTLRLLIDSAVLRKLTKWVGMLLLLCAVCGIGGAFGTGASASPTECAREAILRETGIKASDFTLLAYRDDHGGFHGDGCTVVIGYLHDDHDFQPTDGWRREAIPADEVYRHAVGEFRNIVYRDERDTVFDWTYVRNENGMLNRVRAFYDEDTGLLALYAEDT